MASRLQFSTAMFAVRSRHGLSILVTLAAGLSLALPERASAQDEAMECEAWDIEYSLSATLSLRDTPMNAGNGDYNIGPGRTVLRIENHGGTPIGPVQMRSYEMKERFQLVSKNVLFTTKVDTDVRTMATPDACGIVTSGMLTGKRAVWSKPVSGYRSDGTLTCDGSICGQFGAPPAGTSEIHVGPDSVNFKQFEFSPDLRTMTMQSTQVAKSDSPKQTAYLALSGREVRRTCVKAPPCR